MLGVVGKVMCNCGGVRWEVWWGKLKVGGW